MWRLSITICSIFITCYGIGRSCSKDSDCSNGKVCINESCQCRPDELLEHGKCVPNGNRCSKGEQVFYNGTCYFTSEIGGNCEIDDQCVNDSVCTNLTCVLLEKTNKTCELNKVLIHETCMERVVPGEDCRDSLQCMDGSSCDIAKQICLCPPGMSIVHKRCRKFSSSDPCDQASSVEIDKSCFPLKIPGDNCTHNKQCLSNSECINHICQCSNGTVAVKQYCVSTDECSANEISLNNRCYTKSSLGDDCFLNEQCVDQFTECSFIAKCECIHGTKDVGGICRKTRKHSCKIHEIMVDNVCLDRVGPGMDCVAAQQCMDNSTCKGGICTCNDGLHNLEGFCVYPDISKNCPRRSILINGFCLRLAPPGYSCTANQQCLASSMCSNGTCECLIGYTKIRRYCMNNTPMLQCGENQVYVNGECYDFANVGQYCEITEQCRNGSKCFNSSCICPSGTTIINSKCVSHELCWFLLNGTCYNKAIIGEPCLYNQQCTGGSFCVASICTCPYEAINRNNACIHINKCLPPQISINNQCYDLAKIGQFCIASAQCQGGSKCIHNYCRCPAGTVLIGNTCTMKIDCWIIINDTCYDKVLIGGTCTLDIQCVGGSSCTSNLCTCPNETVIRNNKCTYNGNCSTSEILLNKKCFPLKYVGEVCGYDEQCQFGSHCSTKICTCPNDTKSSDNWCIPNNHCRLDQVYFQGLCYDKVNYGEFCFIKEQCPKTVSCLNNLCKCSHGTPDPKDECKGGRNCLSYQVDVDNVCLDTVSIGMECSSDLQCIASAVCVSTKQLSSKTCQCMNGTIFTGLACIKTPLIYCPPSTSYLYNNNCLSLITIGQYCSYNSQCMGFSACIDSICKCPTDFKMINNICRKQEK